MIYKPPDVICMDRLALNISSAILYKIEAGFFTILDSSFSGIYLTGKKLQ